MELDLRTATEGAPDFARMAPDLLQVTTDLVDEWSGSGSIRRCLDPVESVERVGGGNGLKSINS